jgi:hypothetical protein
LEINQDYKRNSSHNAKEGNGEYWMNKMAIFCDNGMAVIFFSPKKLASLKQRILEGWLQPFLWK